MKGLTDIEGIKVGHASDFDALTGCTAILCPAGAVAGVDVRGGGTGTQEFDTMSPLHVTDAIHAVVLAGGSAFGLEAASGVRRYLAQHNAGFKTAYGVVPIVPSAILYDLGIGKAHIRPTREMGEAAAPPATSNPVVEGCIGAGTGATVGKLFGMSRAMKSGIGSATIWLDGPFAGVRVAAIAAVNAFGDIRDPETNEIIAGARESEGGMGLVDTSQAMKRGAQWNFQRQNTTLGVVATNAKLTKVQATKLAQLAQIGLTRTVQPAHTMFDGDMVIAMSHGTAEADLHALGIAAAEALALAIVRGVRLAKSMGGVPGLG
jgi:L-aminopeptidase/D-esterase-like protein